MSQEIKVGQVWVCNDSKEEFKVTDISDGIVRIKGNRGSVGRSGVKLFKENFQIKVGGK